MKSVRLRLLVLALTPLIVLMPLLLLIGMTRWTTDYDKVLIANVESDLRIAQQYLTRLMVETGDDLELSLDDRGNVVMTKSTLDKILFIASDELPEGDD